MSIRIFFATAGIVSIVSSAYLIIASIQRLLYQYQAPRALIIGFSFTFLVSWCLQGICWLIIGVNNRFWRPHHR